MTENKVKLNVIGIKIIFHSLDLQESVEDAIHRASNYPDLLPKIPRYCSPVGSFYFYFFFALQKYY